VADASGVGFGVGLAAGLDGSVGSGATGSGVTDGGVIVLASPDTVSAAASRATGVGMTTGKGAASSTLFGDV
jgi:hypothetical protein